MSKTQETGHARNVANFRKMIAYISAYGAQYNPANQRIQMTNLLQKADECDAIMQSHNHVSNQVHATIAERLLPFEKVGNTVTIITATAKSCGLPPHTMDNAKMYVRLLKGRRANTKKKSTTEASNSDSSTENETNSLPNTKTISVSHLSFISKVENLERYVDMLAMEPNYLTNESDLTIQALQLLIQELKAKNAGVDAALAAFSVSAANRDEILYHTENGLVAIALQVKAYVLSIFGYNSQLYKDLNKISFKTNKR